MPLMKDVVGDKDAARQTILSAEQIYIGICRNGGGSVVRAVQKMSCILGNMPGLDTNSMNVSVIFDNKTSII